MRLKKELIVLALAFAFGLGGCLGQNMASPEVEFVKIPVTRTVKEKVTPPPPVEVLVVPESCLRMAEAAERMNEAANRLYARGREQKDIVGDARIALATNDGLNSIYEAQHRLSSELVGDLYDLSKARTAYDRARANCESEVP